jgi:hypothetical protein
MKWTRTMNLRYAPIAMRFVIGLMTVMTVVAAIAIWWHGESATAVLKGVLVSAYVCLTFGLGLALAKGHIQHATTFAATAIPIPALTLLLISLGYLEASEPITQRLLIALSAVIVVLFWVHALRRLRKAMQTHSEAN